MSRKMKFKIWRGDKNDGGLKDVTVDVNEGEVVLDVIHRVQATQMGDLAVRWNCKAGKCGSCSMEINGKQVYKVASNSLYACFSSNIDEEFAKEVAKEKPLRIVFKDAGFKDDTAKTNVKQLLKQISPQTEMKVI